MLPLFRDRRVAKTYHAIVVGRVTQRSHTLRRPIEGCDAVTHWRVLDSNAVASHLLVRIETGRTHQIRRHMEEIGHPVLGDRNYGTAEPLPAVLRAVPRQMLHAAGLRFARPVTGQRVRVDAPLPEDFTAWLKRLGLR
jgi:23S rRNA pseudouridine1911/1915/1917 synthase